MGKSANPCLKIISCASDPAEPDDGDLSPPQSRTSSEKRRWSFRKKSVSHRVPSNTVISESQFVGYDKTNAEATTDEVYVAKDSPVPENDTIIKQANETPLFASPVLESEVTGELESGKSTTDTDANLQEYVAVTIQAAIRRSLVLREFMKLKKVVKLQAAVRGHLVRRQATGSLRCVQAIVKMQALVRARLARQALEKCVMQEKCENNNQIGSPLKSVLPTRNSGKKSDKTHSAAQKLLSNGFARQLLDGKPKAKSIHISCDPMKLDSAWQWLERWMTVTSSNVEQQREVNASEGYQGEEEKSNQTGFEEVDGIPVMAVPTLPNLCESKSAVAEDKGESVTVNSGKADFPVQASDPDQCVILSIKYEKEQSQGQEDLGTKEKIFEAEKAERTSDPVLSQSQLRLDASLHSELDSHLRNPVFVTENLKSNAKVGGSEPMDIEAKKIESGLRKLRNPAFSAVQAKFEELSSAPKAVRSVNYVCQDATLEPKSNNSQLDSMANSKELNPMQNSSQLDAMANSKDVNQMQISNTQNPVVHVAASECGTEISISSTLDSPDESEGDGGEIVLELGALGRRHDIHSGDSDVFDLENMQAEAKEPPANSCVVQQQGLMESDRNIADSVSAFELVQKTEQQKEKELSTSSIQIQQEKLKRNNDRSSPERSPKSHVKVPESDGTPSSQVSVSSRTRKAEKKAAVGKPKPKLISKSSPSNPKDDSGENSMEHLSKDAKNAKGRSSFGTAKPDNSDCEPRLTCSGTFPSYMQATESAKAKSYGSFSLKTSPDKDNHIKKRHSLPIGDEKQGSSPRVPKSASQVQQSLKGNSTHSPHTSAERRWQR